MKRRSFLILAAMVLLVTVFTLLPAPILVSPVSAGVNLIQNPGFEEPTGNGNQTPNDWTASTTSPYRDVSPDVHSGSYSAYLHGTSGSYTQTVSVGVDTSYRFEAYTRANASATETVTLTIRAGNGTVLNTHSWNGTNHGWARRIGSFTTPTHAWDAVVTLTISGDVNAEAWFDDILLEEGMGFGELVGQHCFIATAAYGTPMAEEIEVLREFRDEYLLTNPVGQALVSTYYKVSPPVAEFIDDHPTLKPVVRVGLLPAVAMSTVAVNATSTEKVAIVGSLALVSVALAMWLSRRRGKGVIS